MSRQKKHCLLEAATKLNVELQKNPTTAVIKQTYMCNEALMEEAIEVNEYDQSAELNTIHIQELGNNQGGYPCTIPVLGLYNVKGL